MSDYGALTESQVPELLLPGVYAIWDVYQNECNICRADGDQKRLSQSCILKDEYDFMRPRRLTLKKLILEEWYSKTHPRG